MHADCMRIQHLVVAGGRAAIRNHSPGGLPHGLKPKSLASYRTEWDKYSRFVARRGLSELSGKDAPWDLALLTEYMQWRASTCKPSTLTSIFSILAHYGAMPSASYCRIRAMTKTPLVTGEFEISNDSYLSIMFRLPAACLPHQRGALRWVQTVFLCFLTRSESRINTASRDYRVSIDTI